jgi:hypothetical protein
MKAFHKNINILCFFFLFIYIQNFVILVYLSYLSICKFFTTGMYSFIIK